jgi:hypothetical protein
MTYFIINLIFLAGKFGMSVFLLLSLGRVFKKDEPNMKGLFVIMSILGHKLLKNYQSI